MAAGRTPAYKVLTLRQSSLRKLQVGAFATAKVYGLPQSQGCWSLLGVLKGGAARHRLFLRPPFDGSSTVTSRKLGLLFELDQSRGFVLKFRPGGRIVGVEAAGAAGKHQQGEPDTAKGKTVHN